MQHPIRNTRSSDSSARPTRIAVAGQFLILLLLLGSFVSGILVWRGKHVQMTELAAPSWLHAMVVLHGSLNPFLCALFGYLVCHHIRYGWQMRANVISGLVMEATFAGLILTGVGLYYAGSAEWRDKIVWTHRVLGLLVPLGLASHWIAGLLWARKQSSPAVG